MNKVKLHKSDGYAKFNEKRQGVFISHNRGTYKDTPYHKVRLTQVFEHPGRKGGISMTIQKPARFIVFDVNMLKNVAELLNDIHIEIHGVKMLDIIKEVSVAKPKTESDEVDELLVQLASMKRRK